MSFSSAPYGVTIYGLNTKPLSVINQQVQTQINQITSPQTGYKLSIDLNNPGDPLGQVCYTQNEGTYNGWLLLKATYDALNPNTATGAALTAQVVFVTGQGRKSATASTVQLTFSGTAFLAVPSGIACINPAQPTIVWTTTASITLNSLGTGTVQAVCQTLGAITAGAGTITQITTSTPGLTGVNNASDATPGSSGEPNTPAGDTPLRQRLLNSTAMPALGLADALGAALSALDGVTYAFVYLNDANNTDSRGLPANSYAPVVQGGADDAIAQLVYDMADSKSYGLTTVNVQGPGGAVYPSKFTRPIPILMYVSITFTIVNPTLFPSDGMDQIKQAIVNYALTGSASFSADPTLFAGQTGIKPGQNVITEWLRTPAESVGGIKVTSVLVGDSEEDLSPDDYIVQWFQVASFAAERITVSQS